VTASNADVWNRLSGVYATQLALTPPERLLLERLRERWPEVDMLDLGVGAGRTAYTFAALARSYVGIDFAPAMIEHARRLVPETDRTTFVVQDVRDLSPWHGRGFGLVLFSFNGIDALPPDDRSVVLGEVRKVMADGAVFAFSSHSLDALPFDASLRRPSLYAPFRTAYRSVRRSVGLAGANRRLDLAQARRRGWALVRDDAHDFALELCYVSAAKQVADLRDAGFGDCEVLDMRGRGVDPAAPGRDPHLFYIARAASALEP
jgi:SAM-dependent methyltransferase